MDYIVDSVGIDHVVVNGERIEVDPPFEHIPEISEYETWLNEVMNSVVETIRGRKEVSCIKDNFASLDA